MLKLLRISVNFVVKQYTQIAQL